VFLFASFLFSYLDKDKKMNMATLIIFLILLFSPTIISSSDESINLLVRSSANSTIRRYCVELAKLPNGHTVNITDFDWHIPYIASPSVNACNATNLDYFLPVTFPKNTLLVLTEHQCKITEHAWHVEAKYGENISLMILSNRTGTHYELTYNTTAMPVAIPVLVLWQNDFNKINKTYNLSSIEMSIDYGLDTPKKFRPAVLLMFLLVLLILLGGNFWAADEFVRKIKNRNLNTQSESTSTNTSPISNDYHDSSTINNHNERFISNPSENIQNETQSPSNNEPAIIYMPYCIIAVILCFAVTWLLLIYYFPKVMIYILQGKRELKR